MVAKEFLDLVKKFQVTSYNGLEDSADKMSFIGSVFVFTLCGLIVTMKTYILKPIACYSAVSPSGINFDSYIRNYCWVHNTFPIRKGDTMAREIDYQSIHEGNEINYYQWIPLVLGLQCIMFYLPRFLWQIMCYNKTGIDLGHVFSEATEASNADSKGRKAKSEFIAKMLARIFYHHKDNKKTRWANIRKQIFKYTSFFMASRKMGTWLLFWYFVTKVMYLANAIVQLVLMQKFLGLKDNIFKSGYMLFERLVKGVSWKDSSIFPRVTMCRVPNIVLPGDASGRYMAQCVLPQNMLNEKVYIFLWAWVTVVAAVTTLSIIMWLYRVVFRRSRAEFLKKMLKNENTYSKSDREMIDAFLQEFLKHDGMFILIMLNMNSGDIVTSEVVDKLWDMYKLDCAESDTSEEKDPNYKVYPSLDCHRNEKEFI